MTKPWSLSVGAALAKDTELMGTNQEKLATDFSGREEGPELRES